MKRCACGQLLENVLPNQFGGYNKYRHTFTDCDQTSDYAASGSDFLAVQLGLKPDHDVYLNGELTRGKCRGK